MTSQRTMIGLTMLLLLVGVSLLIAEEPTPDRKAPKDMSIADVMQEAHKKPDQLLKKVATGKGNKEDMQRLKELYEKLSKTKPPKGDDESWKAKTELLVSAAQSAIDGEDGAAEELFKAANCVSCHSEHK